MTVHISVNAICTEHGLMRPSGGGQLGLLIIEDTLQDVPHLVNAALHYCRNSETVHRELKDDEICLGQFALFLCEISSFAFMLVWFLWHNGSGQHPYVLVYKSDTCTVQPQPEQRLWLQSKKSLLRPFIQISFAGLSVANNIWQISIHPLRMTAWPENFNGLWLVARQPPYKTVGKESKKYLSSVPVFSHAFQLVGQR